jgi:hypothetical protein
MQTFRPEIPRIKDMYDFMVEPAGSLPDYSEVTVVFGRKSSDLVATAAAAALRSKYIVVSGNVGKDSGDLPAKKNPEATYVIDNVAKRTGIARNRFYADTKAKNGLDNARNSIDIIQNELGINVVEGVAAIIHSTSLRRLGGTLARQARVMGLGVDKLTLVKTGYDFKPGNIFDQSEVAGEIQRVWNLSDPAKGDGRWLDRPTMPSWMYEYAVDLDRHNAAEFERRGILNPSTADDTDHMRPMYTA